MLEKLNPTHMDESTPILETNKNTNRVFLNGNSEATFLCKNCGTGVTRDLSKVIHAQTAIRVKCKCKCGNVFRVLVERRCDYRKKVNLLGMCHCIEDTILTQKRLIKVLDISRKGLQFSTNDMSGFTVGDKVLADFNLDDINNTEIKVKGAVKRIRSKNVGIEFNAIDCQRELTFYLIS
jgi:hypothetical protein